MSFEMKYDRDGLPIAPAIKPVFEDEVAAPQEVEAQEPEQNLQEILQNPEEETEPQEQAAPQQAVQKEQEPSGNNSSHWLQLRVKAAQAEKERDELARKLADIEARQYKQMMQQQQQQQKPVYDHVHEEDDSMDVGADDLVEGKHLKQVSQQMRQMQQQLASYQQQSIINAAEMRLKAEFPDFDRVVSKENIETLRLLEPELAAVLDESTNLYPKAVSAYKFIKQLGIHEQSELFAKDRGLAQKNAAKPKPVASISPQKGQGALSKANEFVDGPLTEEFMRKMYEEARQFSRRRD